MLNTQPDILVTDRNDNPAAAVEVKNREALPPDIATVLRRNLIVHGYAPSTPFFLLLSQEVGYLWKNVAPNTVDAAPDFQFPMGNVIARYLRGEPRRHLSGAELELVISQWLIELTLGLLDPSEEPERTLAHAGFDRAIRGGRVVVGAAA